MDMTTLAALGTSTLAMAPSYGLAALSAMIASDGLWTLAGQRAPVHQWWSRRTSRPNQCRHNQLRRNQNGEGVISAAIAVLIIASLGALMWVGFKALWENAEETTNSEISKIGK